jgi:hypothetical protein
VFEDGFEDGLQDGLWVGGWLGDWLGDWLGEGEGIIDPRKYSAATGRDAKTNIVDTMINLISASNITLFLF